MAAIKYRPADWTAPNLLSRSRRYGCPEAVASARFPEREPHVSRPHPASLRPLPHRRSGPPGFGNSGMPGRGHSFDRIAATIDLFTQIVGFDRYAIYVFDYGAPTGFRLAAKHPDRITAIISQNGNAYEEGLSEGWNPIRAYWQDPSEANREALRAFLKPETTIWQYTHGVPDRTKVSPDGYSLDNFYLTRAGRRMCSSTSSATTRAMSRSPDPTYRLKPRLLAVRGKNDLFFCPRAQGVQEGHPGRGRPVPGHRPFCAGDAPRRDCGRDPRLSSRLKGQLGDRPQSSNEGEPGCRSQSRSSQEPAKASAGHRGPSLARFLRWFWSRGTAPTSKRPRNRRRWRGSVDHRCHMARPEAAQAVVDQAQAAFDRIDALLNIAV